MRRGGYWSSGGYSHERAVRNWNAHRWFRYMLAMGARTL
jgi:hypothetical protein